MKRNTLRFCVGIVCLLISGMLLKTNRVSLSGNLYDFLQSELTGTVLQGLADEADIPDGTTTIIEMTAHDFYELSGKYAETRSFLVSEYEGKSDAIRAVLNYINEKLSDELAAKEALINAGMTAYRILYIMIPATLLMAVVLMLFRQKWGVIIYMFISLVFSALFVLISAAGSALIREQVYNGLKLRLTPGGYIAPVLIVLGALLTIGSIRPKGNETNEETVR